LDRALGLGARIEPIVRSQKSGRDSISQHAVGGSELARNAEPGCTGGRPAGANADNSQLAIY
jgi:hypothetical protein